MREWMRQWSNSQFACAWLATNIIMAQILTYVMDVINVSYLSPSSIYVFFVFVLGFVGLNVVLLIASRGVALKLLFGLTIAWLCFISVMLGTFSSVDVLLNFRAIVGYLVALL